MIKYRINLSGPFMPSAQIKVVEVVRESEKSVWLSPGNKVLKRTSYTNYFDTWEEAHKALLEHAKSHVNATRAMLGRENGMLGNIKGMKKPEVSE